MEVLAQSWAAVFGSNADEDRMVDFISAGASDEVREDAAQL